MTFQSPAIPSRNPTVDKNLKSAIRFVFNKFVQGDLDDMLPAVTIAYNRTTNMATVQPLISMVTTLDEIVPRGQIAQVPVQQDGGGGWMASFPLNPAGGDLGWIKANDRDISLFTQFWRMVTPNTARMHSFEDGVFIPNVPKGFTIKGPDSSNFLIQRLDASFRFSLGSGNACVTDIASYSQSVNCVLDVQSTTRAFAPPRMTTVQKHAIADPFPGMMVYDLTLDGLAVYTAAKGWGD